MKRFSPILFLVMFSTSALLTQAQFTGNTSGSVSFSRPITNAPGYPFLYSLSAGDLNGDGIPDLAVTATIDGSALSYALGAGDGMLKSWSYANAASLPAFVLLADVNGDGNLDALTSDGNFGFIEIDFGDGHGDFPSSTSVNTVYFDGPLAVADLNKDGIADIVGTFYSGGTGYPGGVAVVLGTGHGIFGPERHFGSGGVNPVAFAVGDLNHDGIPDLVVANNGSRPSFGSVTVMIGRGDGTFLPPVRYNAGEYPSSIAIGDFNGDGILDVAVTDTRKVYILLGSGDGTLSAAKGYWGGISPGPVVAADFNGDGKLDLAVVNFLSTSDQVSVLLGNGDGTFQPPRHFPTGGTGSYQMVVADFNVDGKPDLATVNYVSGNISVLLNITAFPGEKP